MQMCEPDEGGVPNAPQTETTPTTTTAPTAASTETPKPEQSTIPSDLGQAFSEVVDAVLGVKEEEEKPEFVIDKMYITETDLRTLVNEIGNRLKGQYCTTYEPKQHTVSGYVTLLNKEVNRYMRELDKQKLTDSLEDKWNALIHAGMYAILAGAGVARVRAEVARQVEARKEAAEKDKDKDKPLCPQVIVAGTPYRILQSGVTYDPLSSMFRVSTGPSSCRLIPLMTAMSEKIVVTELRFQEAFRTALRDRVEGDKETQSRSATPTVWGTGSRTGVATVGSETETGKYVKIKGVGARFRYGDSLHVITDEDAEFNSVLRVVDVKRRDGNNHLGVPVVRAVALGYVAEMEDTYVAQRGKGHVFRFTNGVSYIIISEAIKVVANSYVEHTPSGRCMSLREAVGFNYLAIHNGTMPAEVLNPTFMHDGVTYEILDKATEYVPSSGPPSATLGYLSLKTTGNANRILTPSEALGLRLVRIIKGRALSQQTVATTPTTTPAVITPPAVPLSQVSVKVPPIVSDPPKTEEKPSGDETSLVNYITP